MKSKEEAMKYFENVVNPAIEELIDEYNQREGYRTGYCPDPILFRDKPPVAEHNGINVKFPNNTEKSVSVCWFEGGDRILIGRIDYVLGSGANRMYAFQDADKEFVKDRIRELIGE